MSREVASRERAVGKNAISPPPVSRSEIIRVLVLDEMAQRVAVGPGAAQKLADAFRTSQAAFAPCAVDGESLIVPADGPADLVVGAVDAAGRVVRRRDSTGDPVTQAAGGFQLRRDASHACAGLPFQLHQAQLGDGGVGRLAVEEIGGEPHLGDGLTIHPERQTFNAPRAEVPTDDDTFRREQIGVARSWA